MDRDSATSVAPAVEAAPSQPAGDMATAAKQRRHWSVPLLLANVVAVSLLVAALASSTSPAPGGKRAPVAAARTPRSLRAVNASSVRNPFAGQVFYKNPANQRSYDSSIATSRGVVWKNLMRMREVPSAYWIDVKAKIHGTGVHSLEGILEDASSKSTPELVTFIWYDLPNRDCHAKASNGEICCKYLPNGACDYTHQTGCEAGLKEYKETYADPFVEVLQKYAGRVPVVVVVEPDSLPNLATNLDDPRCGGRATREAYTKGIKYSIKQLTTKTPEVAVYLDAAHGGWLGWQDNLMDFMRMLRRMDLPFRKMRGFATNVANYQPLGALCPHQPDSGNRNGYCLNRRHANEACCADPCGLAKDWSAGNNELNYAQELAVAAKAVLGMDAHMVIDTGRNGQTQMRQACKNWCNIRGAGAGVASTPITDAPRFVDAYFWLKTPGESDGCTSELPAGGMCPRFDRDCASVDSLGSGSGEPRAPEAGHWFDYQVKQLAENARLR
uniref:Glucanase n=1 Tax=Alexandrium andersonii TaxID=327968 RepID=A0A7S2F6F8_9DINO|mmetsp:Transcript_17817/g.40286  ORF Transcript_17817/g.40286 Transcript_17817/m.40286 type:complete len:499 (+) Transcript_17817:86-1582(+)